MKNVGLFLFLSIVSAGPSYAGKADKLECKGLYESRYFKVDFGYQEGSLFIEYLGVSSHYSLSTISRSFDGKEVHNYKRTPNSIIGHVDFKSWNKWLPSDVTISGLKRDKSIPDSVLMNFKGEELKLKCNAWRDYSEDEW